jgi:hypothetical protein
MSIRAIDWAFRQQIASSQDKFVLVALADYANDSGHAWPTITTTTRKTGQDRKTVIAALHRLEARGWIEDTGKRAGKTKQVKVYRLKWANEQKDHQKQNSSVFPAEGSQKRDTEPSIEPLYSLSLSKSEKCDLIQQAEAKRLLAQLSEDTFGEPLHEAQWSREMTEALDRALPVRREQWTLLDWFYRLPAHHRIFAVTRRRQSIKAVIDNLSSELQKILSARRLIRLRD